MRRRELLTLLGGAAAWPLAAHAQQAGSIRRLGVLTGNTEGDPEAVADLAALMRGLAELGWTDGRNIRTELRWGAADVGRLQTLAKELVARQPDLVISSSTPVTAAMQRETRTIPIVFVAVSDPVGSGFVESLARPGGNITGFINIEGSLSDKWIEMLKDVVPGITRAALLFNPDTAPYFRYYLEPFEAAARSSGIEPVAAPVHTAEEIERTIAGLGNRTAAGLVLAPDSFMQAKRNLDLVIALAERYRVPAIYPYRFCVSAGGLISYGVEIRDLYRRAAAYADRILKGAKPADLPVQLPTRFELAINLKTAKALGLNISREFLFLADEVIE
jgi:putative ABC transport system substrate-binding protein